jgi:hypothetical protein
LVTAFFLGGSSSSESSRFLVAVLGFWGSQPENRDDDLWGFRKMALNLA